MNADAAELVPPESSGAERRHDGLPVGRPFVPGVSPNPGGRPKAFAEARAFAAEHGLEALQTLVAIMRNQKAPTKERRAAAEAILDRAFGRPLVGIAVADVDADPTHGERRLLAMFEQIAGAMSQEPPR